MIGKKSINTRRKEEIVDITQIVKEEVAKLSIKEGIATVFIPHTTAGITINENADPDVKVDILHALKSLNFEQLPFRHMEGNSDAHIKSSLMGSSVSIIVKDSKLVLGTWQGIYFCEFDGPRNRHFYFHVS